MNKYVLLDINLASFEGEGEESGTAENSSVATTSTEEVVYGKVDETKVETGEETTETTKGAETDPNTKFEELIKGEYKDAFDKRMQGILDKRFKNSKQTESELGEIKPVIEMLMERYDVKSAKDLFEKVEKESIEELAYKKNLTPEQYKENRELERKANLYDKNITQQEEKDILQQKVATWYKQADEMKETYPDFNLQDWSDNKEFLNLLHANVPVKQAYELLDLDKIKANLASSVKENTVKDIQANKNRPSEVATKQGKGVVVKSDVKSLTKADREEIAKRSLRGEKISF